MKLSTTTVSVAKEPGGQQMESAACLSDRYKTRC